MGFGSGFGWGILSGLGQAYGDYAQRSELEKRKKDYDLWQHELKLSDFLRLSGDPEMEKVGEKRRDLLVQAGSHKKFQKMLSESDEFAGIPTAGAAVTQANVRRQQEAEQKRTQWTTEDTARRTAIQQRAQQGPPVAMGAAPPEAGIGGLAYNAMRQGAMRQVAGETAVREFQELPQRPPSLDRPPLQRVLDPERGLVTTPEYEQAAQEYGWQRQADILGESKIKQMGAERREKLIGFKEYAQWLQKEGPGYGLSSEDISDSIQALITGINPRTNRVQYGQPQENSDGTVTRQIWMNGIPMGSIVVPTRTSQTTRGRWIIDPDTGQPRFFEEGSATTIAPGAHVPNTPAPSLPPGIGPSRRAAPGRVPAGGGGMPSASLNLGGPQRPGIVPLPRTTQAATKEMDVLQREAKQPSPEAPEVVQKMASVDMPGVQMDPETLKLVNWAINYNPESLLDELRAKLPTRTFNELTSVMRGDKDVRGIRWPKDQRDVEGILQQYNLIHYTPKDQATMSDVNQTLPTIRQMRRLVDQISKAGKLTSQDQVKLGGLIRGVSSMMSKALWREAGMLTNQDVQRASGLMPVAYDITNGLSFAPAMLEEWLGDGLASAKLKMLEQFVLTRKAAFNLSKMGKYGAQGKLSQIDDDTFQQMFLAPIGAPYRKTFADGKTFEYIGGGKWQQVK